MTARLSEFTADQLTRAQALDGARWLKCLYDGEGPFTAARLFEQRYPRSLHLDVVKAATTAGTTTDSDWAAPLATPRVFAEALVTLARPLTIIGRLALRQVPFNVSVPRQTAGATFNWAGQGLAKPVGQLAFDSVSLAFAKASGILVVSDELIRGTRPSADRTLRDELVAGLVAFLDEQFVDPAVTEVANVSPASILNGATEVLSSGDPVDDLTRLISTFTVTNSDARALAFLLSPVNAAILATRAPGAFPNLTIAGGTILGVPAVTSAAMLDNIALIDPGRILLADDGELDLSVSRQAAVQMNTTPDDPPTASTVLMSLWSHNLVGVRVERVINWKRVDSAVAYVSAAYIGGSPA